MKKYLKYILLLSVAMLAFTNKLMADEPTSWTFYCDYELKMPGVLEVPYAPKIRSYVYNGPTGDSSELFLYNEDKKEYEKMGKTIFQSGIEYASDFHKAASIAGKKNGKEYSCPIVTTIISYSENKYGLIFGDNYKPDEKTVYEITQGGEPVINQTYTKKECPLNLGTDSTIFPQFYVRLTNDDNLQITTTYNNILNVQNYSKTKDAIFKIEDRAFVFEHEDYDIFMNMIQSDNCKPNINLSMAYIETDNRLNITYKDEIKGYKFYLITRMDYIREMRYLGDWKIVGDDILVNPFDKENDTCKNMLGDKLVGYLQTAYTIIKIASIIIVIVLAMLDFAQNVLSGKEEATKIAVKWGKRLVIVIIILLLPTIIDLIGSLFGYEDIACGIK